MVSKKILKHFCLTLMGDCIELNIKVKDEMELEEPTDSEEDDM